ncbi:hypothetical protein ACTMTJ_21345 [Phytohabitans sp. LJ34]|uniref:hypothetical protein n=1 Tax=Phytohabitans sp. LJ34 TaxID=3452217 RepID=UPI003F895EFF
MDEGEDTLRVPNSALEAPILGAVVFLPSAGLLAVGARRMRREGAGGEHRVAMVWGWLAG